MRCDYCERTDAHTSSTKVIGSPIYRSVSIHEGAGSDGSECVLKARRGYPKGHRDPITEAAHKAMTNYEVFGPKGWVWGY